MSVLSFMAGAIGLKSTFTREVDSAFKTGKNPAHPFCWSDDTVLRNLAEEHRIGKTNWVIAADMAELMDNLDIFNESREAGSRINLRVSKRFDEFFDTILMLGWYEKLSGKENTGPEEIGPNDFLLEQAGCVSRLQYNGGLTVEMHDGWKKMEFGMDTPLRDAVFVNRSARRPSLEIM